MATTVYVGGYGLGTYGTSRYGAISVTHTPDGVQVNVVSDSGVNIIGDARHVVVSLVSSAVQGSVGVIGVANVNVTGYSVTTTLNPTLSFILDQILAVDESAVSVLAGDVVVIADSNHQITSGVFASVLSNETVEVFGSAVTEPIGQDVNVIVNDNVQFILNCKLDVTSPDCLTSIGVVDVTADSVHETTSVESLVNFSSVIVFADSNTTATSGVVSVVLGDVATRTENRVDVSGFNVSSDVNDDVYIVGLANYTMVGVRTTFIINPALALADSNYAIPTGVETTSSLGIAAVSDNARPTFDSLSGFVSVSSVTVSTTYFDYDAVSDAYSRFRKIIVNPGSTPDERNIIIEQESRTIAIARTSTSSDRVVSVAGQPRVVMVDRASTTSDRSALVG